MSKGTLLVLTMFCGLPFFPSPIKAAAVGVDGAKITLQGYCCTAPPVPSEQFSNTATSIVGPGVEFPLGSIYQVAGLPTLAEIPLSVDATPTSVIFSYMLDTVSAPGTFNGYVVSYSGVDFSPIIGVYLDSASAMSPQIALAFTPSSFSVSAPGLPVTQTTKIIVDLDFAATDPVASSPDPQSWALMLTGIIALWFVILRRLRQASLD